MLTTEQRNRHIFHLIESALIDYGKLFGTSYSLNHEAMLAQYNEKDLLLILPDFHESCFSVFITCFVLKDLSISESQKIRDVYKDESIAEFLKGSDSTLRFMNDSNLVLEFNSLSNYSEFAILKSRLLIEIHIIIENARVIMDKIEALLAEQEQVSIN